MSMFLKTKDIQRKHFILGLVCIAFAYLIFEFLFNAYAMLSVDEFWFAHRIYEYKNKLPYRDFAPYKTVLGYYLLLIPMLFTKGILSTLTTLKNVIAIQNITVLLISAFWLKRFFLSRGIFFSLIVLTISDLFLTYSTNIRIDLIGYWFSLFSLLLLLERKYIFAGLLLGLGFITTQKIVWYLMASNIALMINWCCYTRNIKSLWQMIIFNVSMIIIITLYIGFFAIISNLETVLNSIFREAAIMYRIDSYASGRLLYWRNIITLNPLLFLLWPQTLMSLFISYPKDLAYRNRFFCFIYASVVLVLLMFYKQVFPYYMQVTIPIFFVLYSAFFSWLLLIFHQTILEIKIHALGLWLFSISYLICLLIVIYTLHLPIAYSLISVIPFLLSFYATHHGLIKADLKAVFVKFILIPIIFIGGIYPIVLLVMKIFNMNGQYQQANVQAIQSLLESNGDYVSGIELIYDKNQPIPGMRHLDLNAIKYLYAPSEKLRPVMMASLYDDPNVTIESVIHHLKKSYIKFYVNNYRMMAIPLEIKTYLNSQYEHFWGSIYLYSPMIEIKEQHFLLKFSGNYLIEGNSNVILNHKVYQTHAIYYFQAGNYQSFSTTPFRLKLILTLNNQSPEFSNDQWIRMLY